MRKLKIIFIPMLPTLFGRRYQLSKYLAIKNEVHLILWDMPYPITFKGLLSNLKHSWNYEIYKKENITIHKIRRVPFFFPPINKWLFQKQIRKIFNDYNIDVIISQSFTNETDPPIELPMIRDLNDYYEAFADIYGSVFYKLAYRFLEVNKTVKNQIKRARAVLAVSDILVNQARKYNKNVYKVSNGVESWVVSKKNSENKYSFGKHSLVYVSFFGKWSDLNNLLNVIFELKRTYDDIKLILVGGGPEISNITKTIKKLNLTENVKIFGHIWNRNELFEIINSCEICLNLSQKNVYKNASSPIKVFEYSALGKKIVSTNLDEVTNLNFPNIFIYKKDVNNHSLIKTIKYAFDRNIISKDVQGMTKQYTWENITNIIQKIIYDNLAL